MKMVTESVVVRELRSEETPAAAAVLARGMRDNPIHQRVFGADPDRCERALDRLFTELLAQYWPKGIILGAFASDVLVGVCATVEPGRCRPRVREKLALAGAIASGSSLAALPAALRWSSAWADRDPDTPHWHLGPVGVERDLQGRGVGTALLRAATSLMNTGRGSCYLETDKQVNVTFYQRFGFAVTAEAAVLGVPNWFMMRPAAG